MFAIIVMQQDVVIQIVTSINGEEVDFLVIQSVGLVERVSPSILILFKL